MPQDIHTCIQRYIYIYIYIFIFIYIGVGMQLQTQNLRRGGTLMHHATKRGFKDCPGFLNSTGQNWPTCGQTGYVTPVVSGIPTAIELGGRIRIGPLVGKVAT